MSKWRRMQNSVWKLFARAKKNICNQGVPNPHIEKRKSNLNELQSTIQSSDKEKTKEENLYFNIDSTTAPGFGMVIPSPEDVKLQQNSKMKAKIYAASKAEEEHTEFVLIKHFIFDLLSSMMKRSKEQTFHINTKMKTQI